MVKRVLIAGGGTAGWLTAAYLARTLLADRSDGLQITLIESPDIGIIGVGEGTFPSIRKTLKRIGIPEADMVRFCHATFKQGIRFVGWRGDEAQTGRDHYFHPFQIAPSPGGLDLLLYWLLGAAGPRAWDEINTVQKRVVDARLGPKLITHDDYEGPLNYAFHFDAARFGELLRRKAIDLGVKHLTSTITNVALSDAGHIAHLDTAEHGALSADLYIDCTGFRAELIGKALRVPFNSRRRELFTNRAMTIQIPYDRPEAPIASCTTSTAREAGWIWEIGLDNRRGIGYVYSDDHTTDDRAMEVLSGYVGQGFDPARVRKLAFEPGVRERQWVGNCVAVGLSAGFIEPLEATGIGFAEIAALLISNLFPWGGQYDVSAKQFNEIMGRRFDHVVDFIKAHYCLTRRTDTDFWRQNAQEDTMSASLQERLARWRFRAPSFMDVDLNHDIFTDANWQYILYGMGYRTDLAGQAGTYRYFKEAAAAFADIETQATYAMTVMPSHRKLIEQIKAQA